MWSFKETRSIIGKLLIDRGLDDTNQSIADLDGERIDYDPYKVETMVDDAGKILEYFDEEASEKQREIITKIIGSETSKYRLFGREGNVDRDITDEQKKAFQNVIDVYDLLALKDL